MLHSEEELSYKLGKKKKRDLDTLQQVLIYYLLKSLNIRINLTEEIKQLSIENHEVLDVLSNQSTPIILTDLIVGVKQTVDSVELISEGFKKVKFNFYNI